MKGGSNETVSPRSGGFRTRRSLCTRSTFPAGSCGAILQSAAPAGASVRRRGSRWFRGGNRHLIQAGFAKRSEWKRRYGCKVGVPPFAGRLQAAYQPDPRQLALDCGRCTEFGGLCRKGSVPPGQPIPDLAEQDDARLGRGHGRYKLVRGGVVEVPGCVVAANVGCDSLVSERTALAIGSRTRSKLSFHEPDSARGEFLHGKGHGRRRRTMFRAGRPGAGHARLNGNDGSEPRRSPAHISLEGIVIEELPTP